MIVRRILTTYCLAALAAAGVPALAADTEVDASKGAITIRSGDNSLKIGARAQFRWTVDDLERFDGDTAGSGVGVEDGTSSSFDVPRVRLKLSGGVFKPWLKYLLQFEFSRTQGDSSSKIKDARIDFAKNPLATLWLGQYKAPFGMQQLTSSGSQQFVDRAVTDKKFAPGRDMGVTLTGLTESGRFGYAAGAFNGSGESVSQEDEGHMLVGRVWFDPFGKYELSESALENSDDHLLHFGLGFRTGEVAKGSAIAGVFEEPDDETALNLEAAWKFRRYFVMAEYFDMSNEQKNPAAGPDVDSDGFNVQGGVMVIPERAEVGLRYATVDPDGSVDADDVTELRAVFGYFWKGHKLKLQADVGRIEYDSAYPTTGLAARNLPSLGTRLVAGPQKLEDKQFRLQVQVAF